MTTFSFTFRLNRSLDDLDEIDALYARCADATVESEGAASTVHFDRDAESLDDALRAAVVDVTSLGHGIAAIEVEPACVGAL